MLAFTEDVTNRTLTTMPLHRLRSICIDHIALMLVDKTDRPDFNRQLLAAIPEPFLFQILVGVFYYDVTFKAGFGAPTKIVNDTIVWSTPWISPYAIVHIG